MKNLLFSATLLLITLFFACNAEKANTNTSHTATSPTEISGERKAAASTIEQTTEQPPEETAPSPTSKTVAENLESEAKKTTPSTNMKTTKSQTVELNTSDTKITMNKEQGKTGAAIPVTINPNLKPPTATANRSSTTGTINIEPAPKPIEKKVEEQVEIVKAQTPVRSEGKPAVNGLPQDKFEKKPVAKPQLSHEAWDQLLRKYVSASGAVNYPGLKTERKKLDAYLEMLDKFPVQDSWPRAKKMAYWINAYNAATVKLIVDNYPLKSIMDLDGGKPWDRKWVKLGDKSYSLNNIENDILRPQYKDARIHFAVNCAAKSCPPLLNRAWTAANLERNFEKQAKAFINNPQYNEIGKKRVRISKIFEWYADDFGDMISYLNKYANNKANANAKVEYLEYDWALNK